MSYSKQQNRKIKKRKLSLNRNRRKFFRLAPLISVLVTASILGIGVHALFVRSDVFHIAYVEISGTKSFVSETDFRSLAESRVLDNSLITFVTANLRDSLLDNFQGAKNIFIRKKYPRTVVIKVVERVPVTVIHDEIRENFYLIDEDGYVLGLVEEGTTNFPEISYEGDIEIGHFLDKNAVSVYFELLDSLDSEKLQASSMSVTSAYVEMFVDDVEVLVGKDKNISEAVSTLASLLQQLATEGKDVKRVDLRYDKVIVSYRK